MNESFIEEIFTKCLLNFDKGSNTLLGDNGMVTAITKVNGLQEKVTLRR